MPGGEEIASAEGTTQGDSIPTPIHTLGSLSLLDMTAEIAQNMLHMQMIQAV